MELSISELITQRQSQHLTNVKVLALREEFKKVTLPEQSESKPQLTQRVHGRKRALDLQVVS